MFPDYIWMNPNVTTKVQLIQLVAVQRKGCLTSSVLSRMFSFHPFICPWPGHTEKDTSDA